jgi:hypothetical protein
MEAHIKGATVVSWVVYVASVVVLEALFLAITGRQLNEVPQLTLVASTLVIVVLLHPLRRRLRDYLEGSLRERRALREAREAQRRQRR